ncbi:hypothetical protein [Pseudomonas tohonis]|uniref:hypothetical protein n=1 Tax=Pseudomonas tohonis TaxID=2725477 RepID=UPI001F294132|nr:hypothetical protein [Pseudomonas tohonis]
MSNLFDPYRANTEYFVGRHDFAEELVSNAINKRCAVLFGGRQSGKTSLLLSIYKEKLSKIAINKLSSYTCPVYVDLTALPINAGPSDFFGMLAEAALQACQDSIIEFNLDRAIKKTKIKTVEEFAGKIKEISANTGEVDLTLLFLIDESERVLGERFPRGFQDNLFALLYGPEISSEIKIGMIFAGAQGLYKFSEDDTSPIGSRAAYKFLTNLKPSNIIEISEILSKKYLAPITEPIAKLIFSQSGGHPGVAVRFFDKVLNNNIENQEQFLEATQQIQSEAKQLFRLWATALTPKSRALNDALAYSETLSKKEIFELFKKYNWDPLLAERAIEELIFTGVANYNEKLTQTNALYWNFMRNTLPPPSSNEDKDTKSEKHDATWSLIEQTEITLRTYIRETYTSKFLKETENKVKSVLGNSSYEKILDNVKKSNARYRYSDRGYTLDIFDGLYLGQLSQLICNKEAWPHFSSAFKDTQETQRLISTINAVRTDKAHFYTVPERELSRCRLHCEDILAIIEKFAPKRVI